jgi:hypothetical protein
MIPGAVKDMDDFNRILADAVENQKPADGTPSNAEMLVAWHQWVAARGVQQCFAALSRLANQRECASRALLCDIGSDLLEIRLGLGRDDDDHLRSVTCDLSLAIWFGRQLTFQAVKHLGA